MPTTIPPASSHYITLAQFLQMKQAYSDNKNTILLPPYQGNDVLCTSELFNVAAINAVTAVTGCAAVRIYYGMDANLFVHAMLVAVDKNGMDILPPAPGAQIAKDDTDPPIIEEGQRCPPNCP
jgi:hypothetical protein